jgi:glutamate/tyrosine decarboxylase-like PLP-dependent enzyme
MSGILGLPFESVPADASARIDMDALAARLARGDVGTVVATLGTTASGAVDALPELLALRERHGFRLHVDASYGGYFALIDELAVDTRAAFAAIAAVDSIVIDPHKHGLQPYGCSSVLFRDPSDGTLFRHRSPCADSTATDEMQTGFECSRPGAAAVALWATMELLPLVKHGEFAAMLRASRMAALTLHRRLEADRRFAMAAAPALDIVTWAVMAEDADGMADLAHAVLAECGKRGVHLSIAELPARCFRTLPRAAEREAVTCLRAVLLKAEHAEWVDRICEVISDSTSAVLGADGDPAAFAGGCRARQRVRRGQASVARSRAPTN